MSKEELLKYLIAEIDLIMHDKDYRFENDNGTWYSRESCRDLTNEEVFEELRTELRQLADLETKLAESEKLKESYRLQNEHHHLQLLQFYSRLGVEVFGADIHEKALETLMIMKEQLAEKDKAIENWQTMYESVVQTCHNDKEEIERLNKQLATQEKTITNLVEDNRASQEWYKKQLAEKEKERHEEWETGKEWKWEWQKVNQKLEKAEQDKISFALEQLENVKEHNDNLVCDDEDYYNYITAFIDNQIKQLKEGK